MLLMLILCLCAFTFRDFVYVSQDPKDQLLLGWVPASFLLVFLFQACEVLCCGLWVLLCCVVACEFVTRSHRLQKDETLWFRFLFETFSLHFLCFIFFVSYKDIRCSLVVLLNTKNSKRGTFFLKEASYSHHGCINWTKNTVILWKIDKK